MRLTLLEHIVINSGDVDQYATDLSKDFPEFARKWVYRRVRQQIMNDARLLVQPRDINITGAPSYVQDAVKRGDNVYAFQETSPGVQSFQDSINHLKGFFENLAQVLNAPPQADPNGGINQMAQEDYREAEKIVTKLDRMTIDQAVQQSEKWVARASSRTKNAEKDGGEVVMTWPNGYYAFRYTELDTIKRDGAVLQNCLSWGNYWDQISSGHEMVISIRKPNDEPVVAMRFRTSGHQVIECKGKSNLPPIAAYTPFIADLLGYLKATPGPYSAYDLDAIGLVSKDGNWGRFRDVAKLIEDQNGVKVWASDTALEVGIDNRYSMMFTMKSYGPSYFVKTIVIGNVPPHAIVKGMNALGSMTIGSEVKDELFSYDVFWTGKEWAIISERGTNLGQFGRDRSEVIALFSLNGAQTGLIVVRSPKGGDEDEGAGTITVEDGKLSMISHKATELLGDPLGKLVSQIANKAGLGVTRVFEREQLTNEGWYYNGNECVDIREHHDGDGPDVAGYYNGNPLYLYKTQGRKAWMVVSDQAYGISYLELDGHQLLYRDAVGDSSLSAAVQLIADHVSVRGIQSFGRTAIPGCQLGLWWDKKKHRYAGGLDAICDLISQQPNASMLTAFDPNSSDRPVAQFREFLQEAFQADRNEKDYLSKTSQSRLVKALWPKDSKDFFWIEKSGTTVSTLLPVYHVYPADALFRLSKAIELDPVIDELVEKLLTKIDKTLAKKITAKIGKAVFHIMGDVQINESIHAARESRHAAIKLADEMTKETVTDHFKALNTKRSTSRPK